MVVLATVGSVLVFDAPAAQAVTVPYQPGTPQAGTAVYEETFSNQSAAGAPIPLPSYQGGPAAQNSIYTASAAWSPYGPPIGQCNGWIMQAGTPLPNPDDGCARNNGWPILNDMATAMGLYQGQSAAQAPENQVLTAYTNASNGTQAAGVQLQTTTSNIPVIAGHYYSISAIFGETNCFSNHASQTFEIIMNGVPTVLGSGLDPCADPSTQLFVVNNVNYRVAELQSGAIRMPAGVSTVGIRISNARNTGVGNDVAFDLPRIVDVTPQLDKQFSPSTIVQGGTSTLTFTVTNTDDLLAKNGWTFTDNLPAGVVVANPNAVSTTCRDAAGTAGTSATVTATAGTGTISAAGSLAAGQASCTISLDVTSNNPGTYANTGCADAAGAPIPGCTTNFPTLSGLNPPGSTTLTVTPRVDLSITKDVDVASYDPGDAIAYTVTVANAPSTATNPISTATDVAVSDPIPAAVSGASWTCVATTGASCAGGSGSTLTDTVTIPAGGSVTYTITGTVAASATGDIVNTATAIPPATITIPNAPGGTTTFPLTDPNCPPAPGAGCSATVTTPPEPHGSIDIVKYTNGQDANMAPGPYVAPGDPIIWTYVVTNTGNTPVSDVVVTDDQGVTVPSTPSSGDTNGNGILESGETWTFAAPGTAVSGQYANVGTASGAADDDLDPSTPPVAVAPVEDPSHYFGAESGFTIKKYTNGHDADSAPGPYVAVGDPVTWTYTMLIVGMGMGSHRTSATHPELLDRRLRYLGEEYLASGVGHTAMTRTSTELVDPTVEEAPASAPPIPTALQPPSVST